MNNKNEKLQKVLANAGYASRREVERWIEAERINIDGKKAILGDRIDPSNQITLDGKLLTNLFQTFPTRVLIYHKPEGEICTRFDEEDRPTVFEKLPPIKDGRWIMVGRLDINSSGLLLFTNDGELANKLLHPKYEVEREYLVRVLGELDEKTIAKLKRGVRLEDGPARFLNITKVVPKKAKSSSDKSNKWYRVVVAEGRNRLVRRLFESQRLKVNRLKRLRFGDLVMPRDLQPKYFIEIDPKLLSDFLKS